MNLLHLDLYPQGMSGKVQRENPGQHRREFGELKTQDSSQRHSSSVRGHHRSRPRGPPGDEESRSETRPKPDVMGGPLQGQSQIEILRPRFNINVVFPGIGITIIKIIWSWDSLTF